MAPLRVTLSVQYKEASKTSKAVQRLMLLHVWGFCIWHTPKQGAGTPKFQISTMKSIILEIDMLENQSRAKLIPINTNIPLFGGAGAASNRKREAHLNSCSCKPEQPGLEFQRKLFLLKFCLSSELYWIWLLYSWWLLVIAQSYVFSKSDFPAVSYRAPINGWICLVFHQCGLSG